MKNKTVQLVTPAEERPDSEVPAKARRRTFSATYKRRILDKVDQCEEPGEIGSLLRREGLFSSHLTKWRKQRDEGLLTALAPRKRGPKKAPVNPLKARVAELERENARMRKKLEKAEVIIDFQKKASELLGIALEPEKTGRKP